MFEVVRGPMLYTVGVGQIVVVGFPRRGIISDAEDIIPYTPE